MDHKIALRNARILEATMRASSDVQRLWILAELIEDNWKPVDPDLVKAREIVAKNYPVDSSFYSNYLKGKHDNTEVLNVVAGIKYGRETK